MFTIFPLFISFGPFFSSCTTTTVTIGDDIFETYPEYKESYYNPPSFSQETATAQE